MFHGHAFDNPTEYQIRVNGILDSSWSDWFDGFRITIHGDETVLDGKVADQSALHGVLAKINELGLSLISVTQVSALGLSKE
jgi:hypothetical protein